MSVLINIEFPHGCGDCPCLGGEDYNYYCQVTNNGIPLDGHRPDWCPLVEIKPHGRLIDADALNDMINRSYPMTDRVDAHNGYAICQELIKMLPTIIEAEDGT